MTSEFASIPLSSFEWPAFLQVKRDPPPTTLVESDDFWVDYDTRTFFYDAFQDARTGEVRLFAPRMFNTERLLSEWSPCLNGVSVTRQRLIRHQRFDEISLANRSCGPISQLSFSVKGHPFEVPIAASEPETFQGANVLCTVSKDNEVDWIRDWMAFHHHHHKANALLLFDNGSSKYEPVALEEELRRVSGYKVVKVISAKFPYGPHVGASSGIGRARFLQAALLNLARARFLCNARAVLNVDIDELVSSRQRISIFDSAVTSRLGLVMFYGEWRYRRTESGSPAHGDHVWKHASDRPCPSKYCYRPSGVLGRMTLDIHGLQHLSRKILPHNHDFFFAHCRSVTNSWKESRHTPAQNLSLDQRLQDDFKLASLSTF
jgi:hypothetical protein